MKISVPKETHSGETRVQMTPAGAKRLTDLGAEVTVEAGLGTIIGVSDSDYEAVGARAIADREAILREADLVLRLRKPPAAEIALLMEGCIHISFLDPFNERALVKSLAKAGVSAVSMEMIPRTTMAQKMVSAVSAPNQPMGRKFEKLRTRNPTQVTQVV